MMSTQPSSVITCMRHTHSDHSGVFSAHQPLNSGVFEVFSYLKNGDPCIANVIKVDSSFVWVYLPSPTLIVELVPVHARRRFIYAGPQLRTGFLCAQEAGGSSYTPARHVGASQHPVLSLRRADERMVIRAIGPVVAAQEGNVILPAGEGRQVDEKYLCCLYSYLHTVDVQMLEK